VPRTTVIQGQFHCEDCGHHRIAYNSCRNRRCPKCQGAAAKNWLAAREADLLPVGYFREAVDDIDTRQRPHEFGEGGPDGLSRAFVVTMIGSFTALAASAQPRPVVRKGHAISTA